MPLVQSIEELVEKLNHSDSSNQGKVFKQLDIPLSDFERYASWDDESYTRNCIYRTDEFELILICWKQGDETPVHDHDGQDCWVYQLEGDITEFRYDKKEPSEELEETSRMQLSPGNLTFMNNAMGYHKLINEGSGQAMTLHFYASPITKCAVFNENKSVFEIKELEYDTVNGEALSEVN